MSKHWIDVALEIANEEYYRNHLAEEMNKTKVPDEGSIPVPTKEENNENSNS